MHHDLKRELNIPPDLRSPKWPVVVGSALKFITSIMMDKTMETSMEPDFKLTKVVFTLSVYFKNIC